jgi:RNA polymerase sigma factor (sigma-70 family)
MKTNKTDIERLFRAHYQEMYHLARCILVDDAESKDVVSEVFAELLAHPAVLLPESETGYLLRAVRNRCRNVIAHKSMRQRIVQLLLDDEKSIDLMTDDGLTSQLAELIRQLEPPLRRKIVTLRFMDDQTYLDIAQALGVSKVTVYNHLSEALRQLKQQLKSKDNE